MEEEDFKTEHPLVQMLFFGKEYATFVMGCATTYAVSCVILPKLVNVLGDITVVPVRIIEKITK